MFVGEHSCESIRDVRSTVITFWHLLYTGVVFTGIKLYEGYSITCNAYLVRWKYRLFLESFRSTVFSGCLRRFARGFPSLLVTGAKGVASVGERMEGGNGVLFLPS